MSTAARIDPEGPVVAAREGGGRSWRRLALPAAVAGTLATATLALHVRDPHQQGSWGVCASKMLMGIDCPGCGGLRAVNDLTNLQVVDAASSNLLFVASIPFLVYMFGRWTWGRWTGRPWDPSDRAMTWSAMTFVVLLIAFAVLRNTPAGSWLAS